MFWYQSNLWKIPIQIWCISHFKTILWVIGMNFVTNCILKSECPSTLLLSLSLYASSGINSIIHYYECKIVKFHQGDKIHSLGRSSAKSETMNLGPEVEFCNWICSLHWKTFFLNMMFKVYYFVIYSTCSANQEGSIQSFQLKYA